MSAPSTKQGREAGYSVGELAIVLAIVGLLSTLATPLFLSYYQSSRVRVGAQEVAAFLHQGRELAIKENDTTGVCVHIASTAVQYYVGSSAPGGTCTNTGLWTGPGSDSSGNLPVGDGIALTTSSDIGFTYLGNASPGGTVTVTNSQTGQTLHVTVALSGRVSIGP